MPALKFAPNTPKVVTFTRDDCWKKENTNEKGSWTSYNYQVESDGEALYWYAHPNDHGRIIAMEGFGKGAVVSMENKMTEGEKYGTLHYIVAQAAIQDGITVKDSETQEIIDEGNSARVPASTPSTHNATQAPQTAPKPTGRADAETIYRTMQWAHACAKSLSEGTEYSSEDTRTMATTMFLACKEQGAWLFGEAKEEAPAEEAKVKMVTEIMDGGVVSQESELPF
jgi:hypothetical protein